MYCRRYQDMPITDILQMMGRAGRTHMHQPSKGVVMVHEPKKSFYIDILYEPFPVESSLADQARSLCAALTERLTAARLPPPDGSVAASLWSACSNELPVPDLAVCLTWAAWKVHVKVSRSIGQSTMTLIFLGTLVRHAVHSDASRLADTAAP